MIDTERVIVQMNFGAGGIENDPSARVLVEQADLKISRDPKATLYTSPLGAGLGVAVYNPEERVGGLLNCMLPTASLDPHRAAGRPALFLDTGWAELMSLLQPAGTRPENLRVFVAGGAEIIEDDSLFNIGKLNQNFLRDFLLRSGVQLNAENLGGRFNCSLELVIATGEVQVNFSGRLKSKFLCQR